MGFQIFKTSNAAALSELEGSVGTITGKNGFTTRVGSIPLWCSSYIVSATSASSNGFLRFNLTGLEGCLDVNFNVGSLHVLHVANSIYNWSKGNNFVEVSIRPNNIGTTGFVGTVEDRPTVSARVLNTNVQGGWIEVKNESFGPATLAEMLDTTPFQVKVHQILDSRYMNANTMYVEGTYQTIMKVNSPLINTVSSANYYGYFGRTDAVENTSIVLVSGANAKKVQRHYLTQNSYATNLAFYVSPASGAASATVSKRGIIYNVHTGNQEPNALVAQTLPHVGHNTGWNFMNFESPILLPKGNYWIGLIANAAIGGGGGKIGGNTRQNTDTYSDGATALFGRSLTNSVNENNIFVGYFYNLDARTNVGYYTANVGVTPKAKKDISVFVDGRQLSQSDFEWEVGTTLVNIPMAGDETEFRTYTKRYHKPTIETGDWIYISGQNNWFKVARCSYIPADLSYNAWLTANGIYRINVAPNLNANVSSGSIAINISTDLEGTIGNVSASANTFTIDYNENEFQPVYSMKNENLYRIEAPLDYFPYTLGQDAVLTDLPIGTVLLRTRSINPNGNRSPWVTTTIFLTPLPISKPQNITFSEITLSDRSDLINAVVSWDALIDQEVASYELVYAVSGENDTVPVTVSVSNRTTPGSVSHTINNLPRGSSPGVNKLTVQITPITNGGTRGLTATSEKFLMGKVVAPEPVDNFAVVQVGSQLFFTWNYRLDSLGQLASPDTTAVEIRQTSGDSITESTASQFWSSPPIFATASVPATSAYSNIENYGTYTYMIRTKNSSGLYSTTIRVASIITSGASTAKIWKAWNEDTPATALISDRANENASEYNFMSMLAINNGLSMATSNAVDNANGSATYWTYVVGDNTSIQTSRTTKYYTQVRDLGANIRARVLVSVVGDPIVSNTFNELYSIYWTGTTTNSGNSSILLSTNLGMVLGSGNTSAATCRYDANNKTLVSGGVSGNVWAIWNPGQFSGDISNTNSFAYIAGIINTHAVRLGGTFNADGTRTFSNALSNLTQITGNNFHLVDLKQFVDPAGTATFDGNIDPIKLNVRIRTSCTSPFAANSNIVQSSELGSPTFLWQKYSAGERRFRYLQLSVGVENDGTANGYYKLDQFRYQLESTIRTFTNTVVMTASPMIIDYSSMEFGENPDISLTMLTPGNYSPTVVAYNRQNASINVYNNVGANVQAVNVSFRATGV